MEYLWLSLLTALDLLLSLDREVLAVATVSVSISLGAVMLAALVGVPLGLLVALVPFPGRSFLEGALNALMALPTVVVGLVLYGLLAREGPLGEWNLLFTRTAILLGQFVLVTPLIWGLSIAAARAADPRIDDTCRHLGASLGQRLWMLFRELRYVLLAAVIAGFGRAISEVGISMIVGGNIQGYTRTLTTAIALETTRGEFEFALALGIVLLLAAASVTWSVRRLQGGIR